MLHRVFEMPVPTLQLPIVPPEGIAVQVTWVCPALTEQKSVVEVVAEQKFVVPLSELH